MRLLACLAAAVCGNLVATLYHQELPSFSDRLMNQANTGQLLYYALDSGKSHVLVVSVTTVDRNIQFYILSFSRWKRAE